MFGSFQAIVFNRLEQKLRILLTQTVLFFSEESQKMCWFRKLRQIKLIKIMFYAKKNLLGSPPRIDDTAAGSKHLLLLLGRFICLLLFFLLFFFTINSF
jgi:hypothetical protein